MLKGIIINDKEYKWEDYLNLDEKLTYPLSIKRLIYLYQNHERHSPYTPSNLGRCMRQNKWEFDKDYYIPEHIAYGAVRGTLIHKILEESLSTDKDSLKELKVKYLIPELNYELKGQIDLVRNGILYDYKSTSDNSIKYTAKNGIKTEYIWQTNIYKWLLKKVLNIEVKDIKIYYITMNNIYETGKSYQILNKLGKEELVLLPNIPILPDIKIEKFILSKLNFLKEKSEPEPIINKDKCKYCYFYKECFKDIEKVEKEKDLW